MSHQMCVYSPLLATPVHHMLPERANHLVYT